MFGAEELKTAYCSYLRTIKSKSGTECPPLRELFSFFGASVSQRRNKRILNHIVSCRSCFEKFEWCLVLSRQIHRTGDEITLLKGDLDPNQNANRNGFRVRFVEPWTAAFGVGLAFLFFSILFIPLTIHVHRPLNDTLRGSVVSAWSGFFPSARATVSKKLLVFRWLPVPSAEYYFVEVFDSTMASIWRSDKAVKPEIAAPRNLQNTMSSFREYFWIVTAFTKNGEFLESPMMVFRSKD